MKTKCFVLLVLSSWTCAVWAQSCPNGIPSAGNPGCIPPGNSASPYYQNYPASRPNAPHWQLTWGAIASDESGDIGVAVGHFSRGKAKRDALEKCATYGAKNCKINLAYKNQCAVIAKPAHNGESIAGTVVVQGGPSIEVASTLALSTCAEERGGSGECKIIYSDCTRPVLVR